MAKAAVESFKASDEYKALIEEIKAQALDEHKKVRESIAARLKELEGIHPFKDDAERQTVEAKVIETVTNEVEYRDIKEERYQLALASAKKPAPKAPIPATLVARASGVVRNPFDFTEEG